MRWEALFEDLEAQAAALSRAERAAEVEERTRAEVGALGIADRLRAALAMPVRIHTEGGLRLAGTVRHVGSDWLLLDEGAGREAVVATAALLRVSGLGPVSAPSADAGQVEQRLGLRHALRRIARDRSGVALYLRDAQTLWATIDRVGADFLEVALHASGEPRRRGAVREVTLLALSAVVAVRRDSDGTG